MNEQEIRQFSVDLMETAEAVYVTTIGCDGFPQTRAMFNLRNKAQFPTLSGLFAARGQELFMYLSTNTSSTKMDEIRRNPAVSLYFCRPAEFFGLMLGGTIEVVTDTALKKRIWQNGWERYYPAGPEDPDYTVLRLAPAFAKGWNRSGSFALRLDDRQ
ncbi:MAG: pyridoxamine 5'-phosphate oxidase family protein [Planctomycetota bacterium]|jgi:general stress protein 26